jgi:DNA-binding LacI/PurR family transcriptional regulator
MSSLSRPASRFLTERLPTNPASPQQNQWSQREHASIDLTTVHQDAAGLAQHAVRFAVEMLEQKHSSPDDVVLEPKLVIRGTTAGPRHA